jgi:hypothetical protein
MKGARGRQSEASRGVVVIRDDDAGIIERPKPVDGLSSEEKAEWDRICGALPAAHFAPVTWPIVATYCRHVVVERRLARMIHQIEATKKDFDWKKYLKLIREHRAESAAVVATLRALRLTPLSLYNSDRSALPQPVEKPWLS